MNKLAKWSIAILVGLSSVTIVALGYSLRWSWTGFGGKTLWDWLNLLATLAIPAAVGFATLWFTAQQGKESNTENIDNQREAALQAYIDAMSTLLLEKQLQKSQQDDEVRNVARVRTLTVVRRLDAERKGTVVQFLWEAGLLGKDNPVVKLNGAELNDAWLGYADLREANLTGADLSGANLNGTTMPDGTMYSSEESHAKLDT